MELKVLASGSTGNCYILGNDKDKLILDCGIPYKKILEGLNYDLTGVKGCLVTHEHLDHAKAVPKLVSNGIHVYTSVGTEKALEPVEYSHRIIRVESEKQIKIGNFNVLPFKTEHDCAEPLGFAINHKDMGTLLFATDTFYIRYNFKKLSHLVIECNYKADILADNFEKANLSHHLMKRIQRSHFELGNLKTFLRKTDLSNVKTITLIHLSSDNSDGELFQREIMKITGKPVYIASEGMTVQL